MQLNTHANLLSIFSFIIGGLQLLMALLIGIYFLMMGFIGVLAALDPGNGDPGGVVVIGIIAVVFGLMTVVGLVASIINLALGFKLRSPRPVSKGILLFASILNCVGMMFGGVFSLALGVYGIWFALSDAGKHYFAGNVYTPVAALPHNPAAYNYGPQAGARQNEPYRWQ